MRYVQPAPSLEVPVIALGCMRISNLSVKDVDKLIGTAVDSGVTFFDHADIYGGGKCEEVFGKALKASPGLREKIQLQSKCGIRKGQFDFSKEHILASVDGILKRLDVEYIDTLLLHRPDALMEPREVAEAFDQLEQAGKVRYFGVSNQNPWQMELLKQAVQQPLLFNQLQFSAMFTGMVDAGLNVNMKIDRSIDRDGGILNYCQLQGVTVQAWSPFQYGFFEGVFVGNKKFPRLNKALDSLAEQYDATPSAIAAAWLLRYPVNMQVILGTTQPSRVKDISRAADIRLNRKEWYQVYLAAGNELP
ncbi:MAG: aldo/keto reductase [Christensenellales bacterium]|jgi:predicted oxidoreductase